MPPYSARSRWKSVTHRPLDSADAARLVREAEDCFRFARLPGLKSEIAEGLEVAGHELMAKAVEIETGLQHAQRKGCAATQPWGDGLEGHARALLQLSYSCKESASAEEIRKLPMRCLISQERAPNRASTSRNPLARDKICRQPFTRPT